MVVVKYGEGVGVVWVHHYSTAQVDDCELYALFLNLNHASTGDGCCHVAGANDWFS